MGSGESEQVRGTPHRDVDAEEPVPEVVDGRREDGEGDAPGREVEAAPTAASRQPWLARPRTRSSASMPKAIVALSVTPAYVITWGAIQNESRPMRRCQRMSH